MLVDNADQAIGRCPYQRNSTTPGELICSVEKVPTPTIRDDGTEEYRDPTDLRPPCRALSQVTTWGKGDPTLVNLICTARDPKEVQECKASVNEQLRRSNRLVMHG